jgi:hypothetical protein
VITDTELKLKAYDVLREKLNLVDVERFISIIQKEKFDYTKWRENLFEDMTNEDIIKEAIRLHTLGTAYGFQRGRIRLLSI